jgi:uncharacterized RmlC-like cupin family protein
MAETEQQFVIPKNIPYVKNYGAILRNLLNGVKQDAVSFAKIHNLDAEYLEAVMNSEKPMTDDIILAIMNHPPINFSRLFEPAYRSRLPLQDDTTGGVIVCSYTQTMSTKRIFDRGPSKTPYYEYADTAMSVTSPFRPEWIKELYLHDGINPDLPDWAFNKGHFEFQMTYFIGPVNFHWIDNNGKKHVRQMDTGDINYIIPFVPHSFSTRKHGEGLILAVTYGGAISAEDFQTKIQSESLQDFVRNIKGKFSRLEPNLITDKLGGVIVRKNEEAIIKEEGHYTTSILLEGIPYQPNTRALEYDIKHSSDKKLDIKADAERWGYNVGDTLVKLLWKNHEKLLGPGDSFFIKPGVEHAFRLHNGHGKLVVMEILPDIGDPLGELALINKYSGDRGIARVHTENTRWF